MAIAFNDDGSTLLVGSLDEDCDATGINAAPCDNDQKEDVSMGAAYVVGQTTSVNFPTANAYDASHGGLRDTFLLKLTPAGDALVFSTYLGGSNSEFGEALALAVDHNRARVGFTCDQGQHPSIGDCIRGRPPGAVHKAQRGANPLAHDHRVTGGARRRGSPVTPDG